MSSKPIFENFFENFVNSVAASRHLLQRAHDEGNLIEGVILYASLIDALLRNLIAHKTAVPKSEYVGNSKFLFDDLVLDEKLFQHDESKWLSERKVYKMALDNGIINTEEFEQLNQMYSFRNRIVHRFIISDVAYSDLEVVLAQYESFYQKFFAYLSAIEQPASLTVKREEVYEMIVKKIDRNFKKPSS